MGKELCPDCDGTGYVTERILLEVDEVHIPTKLSNICEKCKGKGVIDGEEEQKW